MITEIESFKIDELAAELVKRLNGTETPFVLMRGHPPGSGKKREGDGDCVMGGNPLHLMQMIAQAVNTVDKSVRGN